MKVSPLDAAVTPSPSGTFENGQKRISTDWNGQNSSNAVTVSSHAKKHILPKNGLFFSFCSCILLSTVYTIKLLECKKSYLLFFWQDKYITTIERKSMNETFKLILKRSGIVGSLMKLCYSVDDSLSGKISSRQTVELELPRKEIRLKIYFNQFIFASPQKELLLSPAADTEEIIIDIGMDLRILGMLPPFSFFYPSAEFIIRSISYHPAVKSDLLNDSLQTFKPLVWKKILRFLIKITNVIVISFIFLLVYGLCQFIFATPQESIKPLWADSVADQENYWQLIGSFIGTPIACFILCIFSKILFILSDKLRQKQNEQISCNRPFILYLRSFKDDLQTGSSVDLLFASGKSEEEVTVEVLSDIAPVVAIGSPLDKNLPKGANRIYVEEKDWKETAKQLLVKAKLVVLRLGDTSNLWWEIENCLKLCPKEKLVFFIPAMKNFNNALKLCEHLKNKDISIPENLELTIQKTSKGSISSILYFINGNLCCCTLKTSRYAAFFVSYKKIFTNALHSLFESFGIKKKKYNILRVSNIIFSLLLLNIVYFTFLGYVKFEEFRSTSHQLAHDNVQTELLEYCRKNSPGFDAIIKGQPKEKQLEKLFKLFGAGLNKMPDDIWILYQSAGLKMHANYTLKSDSFYFLICKGKEVMPAEIFELYLKIIAYGITLAINNEPDRPAIFKSEILQELEYFDNATDTVDDTLSSQEEAKIMLKIIESMKKKQLNPAKFLRYHIQQQQNK